MDVEIEAKWLNVDLADFREKLKAVNAVLIQPERPMTRSMFDYPDKRLAKIGGWVRVRDEGDKVTLSYKQLSDRTLHGTKEVSVIVGDFNASTEFLKSIGLESKSFQETKRESWKLGDVEIELDTWPWIPSFVEIEAANEGTLKEAAERLGLDYGKATHGSVEPAYQAVYNVTDEEIDGWAEIRFSDVPAWLVAKKKT